MQPFVPKHITSISPYVPGKPLEELEREYGIVDSIKLASNENPLGPSPRAVAAVRQALAQLHRYPDGSAHALTWKLAERLGVAPETIVLGNGSDEVIGMLTRTFLSPGCEALLPDPSFLMYEITIRAAGAVPVKIPLTGLSVDMDALAQRVTPDTRMIFVNNPNNPTGTIVTKDAFARFLDRIPPEVIVVLDEAYIEFVRDPRCARGMDHLGDNRMLVTLRTFSKLYGLAGLRVGYGVMPAVLAGYLHRTRMPFNTNTLAQVGALAALDDEDFVQQTLEMVHSGLDYLFEALKRRGIAFFPTQTNFFLIDVGQPAGAVFERMLRQGVIVRSMESYGYPTYIRVNVGLAHENRRFVNALEKALV